MTVNEAITKIRVMLGAEDTTSTPVVDAPVVEETPITMAEAELVDGTKVFTEGELAVGAILYIAVEEGDAPFAPEGMHQTTDGQLITVGMNGEITAIEDAPAAEVVAPEAAPSETAMTETFDAEELLTQIAALLAPYQESVTSLQNSFESISERFNKIADEPGAAPVRNTFAAEAATKKSIADNRIEALIALRKGKK